MRRLGEIILLTGICTTLTYCMGAEAPPDEGTSSETESFSERLAAVESDPERSAVSPSFADLDVDGNGFLDAEETRQVTALREIFSLADSDQDDRLSVAEFSQATIEATRVSPEAARGPLFPALDRDENGRISVEEASEVPQLRDDFTRFDTDGSGGLDGEEYRRALDHGLTEE
jgi:Ca2+-binding EF-hand superfamily protein